VGSRERVTLGPSDGKIDSVGAIVGLSVKEVVGFKVGILGILEGLKERLDEVEGPVDGDTVFD